MLLRVLTAACELVAFLKPFLRQPRKNKRKPRSIPCLRVAEYFRVVDRLRDVFLRIRHHRFSAHFLSIDARYATRFVEHLAGCSPNLLSGCLTHDWLSRVGSLDPHALLPEGQPLPSRVMNSRRLTQSPHRREPSMSSAPPSGIDVLLRDVNCGQPMPRRQLRDKASIFLRESVDADNEHVYML